MKPEYTDYLEMLRESGRVNMLGAVPFLQHRFNLTKKEAGLVLSEWIQNYGKKHRGSTAGLSTTNH